MVCSALISSDKQISRGNRTKNVKSSSRHLLTVKQSRLMAAVVGGCEIKCFQQSRETICLEVACQVVRKKVYQIDGVKAV